MGDIRREPTPWLLLCLTVVVFAGMTAAEAGEDRRWLPGRLLVRLRVGGTREPNRKLAQFATGTSFHLPPGIAVRRTVGSDSQSQRRRLATGTVAAASAATTGGRSASTAAATTATLTVPPASQLVVVDITDGSSVSDKLEELRQYPGVLHAEPDYLIPLLGAQHTDPLNGAGSFGKLEPQLGSAEHTVASTGERLAAGLSHTGRRLAATGQLTPNDPKFASAWHLPKIQAPQAWATTTGSRTEVKVCVVDSGTRKDHVDLKANLAGGWNRGCTGDCNSVSDFPTAADPSYNDYSDFVGHGTAVTGVLGAAGNNSLGVTGVNWKVGIYTCRASASGSDLSIISSSVIECFDLCREVAGMKVVIAAFGARIRSEEQKTAVQRLADAGILLVAAAGNDGANADTSTTGRLYPAYFSKELPNVLSVAATSQLDTLAEFSNYGSTSVHLGAPGQLIWTTGRNTSSHIHQVTGTSVAAPMVAGAAALLWSTRPGLGYEPIKEAILSSVDPLASLAGKVATGGRLNIAAALAAVKRYVAPPPSPPAPPPSYTHQLHTFYSFSIVQDQSTGKILTKQAVANATSDVTRWQECANRCMALSWCTWFMHYPADGALQMTDETGKVTSGSCYMLDSTAQKTGAQAYQLVTSGRKISPSPPPPRPPRPPPPPRPKPPPRPPPPRPPSPPRPRPPRPSPPPLLKRPRPPPPRPRPRPPSPRPPRPPPK